MTTVPAGGPDPISLDPEPAPAGPPALLPGADLSEVSALPDPLAPWAADGALVPSENGHVDPVDDTLPADALHRLDRALFALEHPTYAAGEERLNRALLAYSYGWWDDAAADAAEAAAVYPYRAAPHLTIGLARLQQGQPDDALPSLEAAVRYGAAQDPAHGLTGALVGATVHDGAGRAGEALRLLATARDTLPLSVEVLAAIAVRTQSDVDVERLWRAFYGQDPTELTRIDRALPLLELRIRKATKELAGRLSDAAGLCQRLWVDPWPWQSLIGTFAKVWPNPIPGTDLPMIASTMPPELVLEGLHPEDVVATVPTPRQVLRAAEAVPVTARLQQLRCSLLALTELAEQLAASHGPYRASGAVLLDAGTPDRWARNGVKRPALREASKEVAAGKGRLRLALAHLDEVAVDDELARLRQIGSGLPPWPPPTLTHPIGAFGV